MSNHRKHRRLRRLALGLACASIVFASCVSVAAATRSDTGDATATIPRGENSPIDWQKVQVIPYLSHGTLTETGVKAASIRTTQDPYLTDVQIRPGESLGGPDGGPKADRDPNGSQDDLFVDRGGDDIGGAFADECRRLRASGHPLAMAICMDLGALGGLGADRD